MTNFIMDRKAQLDYSYDHFAHAKVFVFRKWCEMVVERCAPPPTDLSGSCKYGSLFMNSIFGGAIHGHYEHQYNIINGRIVDLSHDAIDVGKIINPYHHEPEFFEIPENQISLNGCLPRVERWVSQFLTEVEAAKSSPDPQTKTYI